MSNKGSPRTTSRSAAFSSSDFNTVFRKKYHGVFSLKKPDFWVKADEVHALVARPDRNDERGELRTPPPDRRARRRRKRQGLFPISPSSAWCAASTDLPAPGRRAHRPSQGRGVCEAVEITAPALPGRVVHVIPEEEVEKGFPYTGQLLEAASMPGIGDGQIEELQRPEEGQAAVFGVLVELSVDGYDPSLDVYDGFDQVSDASFGHDLEITQQNTGVDDLHEVFITHMAVGEKPCLPSASGLVLAWTAQRQRSPRSRAISLSVKTSVESVLLFAKSARTIVLNRFCNKNAPRLTIATTKVMRLGIVPNFASDQEKIISTCDKNNSRNDHKPPPAFPVSKE